MAKTILVAGYAKIPVDTSLFNIYKLMSVALEIDAGTGEVLKFSATLVTSLANDFFNSIFVGTNMEDGTFEKAVEELSGRYLARSKKALVSALYDALSVYNNYKQGN